MYIATIKEITEYIARTHKGGGEFVRALQPDVLEFEELTSPPPPTTTNVVEIEIWKMDLKEYREKLKIRTEIVKQAYAVVFGQCSLAV
mmetsp:Transcript_17734/g.25596  ORF Transcript_17734/g.25596 Transcript_17734/m.25596 type:complete len:88 (-) Transcript_17734:750-1013(-)